MVEGQKKWGSRLRGNDDHMLIGEELKSWGRLGAAPSNTQNNAGAGNAARAGWFDQCSSVALP
jgi:hypothetical protein